MRRRLCTVGAVFALLALSMAGCAMYPSASAAPPHTSQPSTSQPSTSQPNISQPNIVYVLTDDLSWNLVKYMPHVEAMAKAGVTLTHFYVIDSLCCPSRAAILTGEYPHDDGVFTNGGSDGGYHVFTSRKDQLSTFGITLQKAGYRTGFMGKYLNGYLPADPVPPGWDTWDVAGDGYPEFDYSLNENGTPVHYGHAPGDYLTDVLTSKAEQFIGRAGASSRPFMLEVATFAPHRPSVPAPRDASSFPGLTAPRTAAFDTRPTDALPWLKAIPPLTRADERSINKRFRLRVQSVQAVDEMIGRLEDELKAKGLAGNTYFVFGSDNGFHMGEYQLRPGKQTAFDTDIRVPLMVTGPGIPAGKRVSAMTSSIDLAPTFETLGGAPVPATCDGVSLSGLWHGGAVPADWQQAVLVEHHGPDWDATDPDKPGPLSGNPPSFEAVRSAHALYVRYDNGSEAYYDTSSDPYELHNIASTASASTLAPMRHAVQALSHCHGALACQAAARFH